MSFASIVNYSKEYMGIVRIDLFIANVRGNFLISDIIRWLLTLITTYFQMVVIKPFKKNQRCFLIFIDDLLLRQILWFLCYDDFSRYLLHWVMYFFSSYSIVISKSFSGHFFRFGTIFVLNLLKVSDMS